MKDGEHIDWNSFNKDLGRVLTAIANLLEREWPSRYRGVDSAQQVFEAKFGISITTFHAILSLCSETPDLPNRKLLPLATAPLVRQLFEDLISTIFMLHDIGAYTRFLMKTGYREKAAEVAHYEKYPTSGEKWKAYIVEIKSKMKDEVVKFSLTAREEQHSLNEIQKWPTPGKVIAKLRADFPSSGDLDFLEYVNSWLYRTLSADSHVSLRGLMDRGMYFTPEVVKDKFGPDYKETLKNSLEDYRTRMLWTAITLIMAITSELNAHFAFDRKAALVHLWRLFEGVSEISEEFYQFRYRDLLS